MGTQIKIEFRDQDIRKINAALAGLDERMRHALVMPAIKAGGEILRAGVARRMPVDEGVARDALYVKTWSDKKKHLVGAKVLYRTAVVKAHSPKSAKYPDGFFYPAVIEYGSQALNRVPIAPMRRTEEGDKPAAVNATITAIRSLSTALTDRLMAGV